MHSRGFLVLSTAASPNDNSHITDLHVLPVLPPRPAGSARAVKIWRSATDWRPSDVTIGTDTIGGMTATWRYEAGGPSDVTGAESRAAPPPCHETPRSGSAGSVQVGLSLGIGLADTERAVMTGN